MCESTYGADRPLELQSFTDIVDLYPASGIALIKRSPVIAVSSISVRREVDNFGSSSSEWQLLTSNEYSVDTEINQVNINYSNNWGMLGARRSPMQAKITYTSGFDFSTDTSQEGQFVGELFLIWNNLLRSVRQILLTQSGSKPLLVVIIFLVFSYFL
jgi:hypothetical protein